MIIDKINKFIRRLPSSDHDLQIGCLYFWFINSNYQLEKTKEQYNVLKMHVLLLSDETIIFSGMSDVLIWELRKFYDDLISMNRFIGTKMEVEFNGIESQFHLKMISNPTGQITIKITYSGWGEAPNGSLEFQDRIDQSYLPSLITKLGKVLADSSLL